MNLDLEQDNVKLTCKIDCEYIKDSWGEPVNELHLQIKTDKWYSLGIISIRKNNISNLVKILQRLEKLLVFRNEDTDIERD